ncbi:MAG: hypothetical protein PHV20_04895 [Bacteroidales bacterium]|nr:hypothetical protein [Bacteroidales bacterium]
MGKENIHRFSYKLLLFLAVLYSISAQSQVRLGLQNFALLGDLTFPTPKNELANFYSPGDPIKAYWEGSLSFAQIGYGQNSPFSLNASVLLAYETANFGSNDFSTDGLDAKIISHGVRLKPLNIHKISDVSFNPINFSGMMDYIVDGLYLELGSSSATLVEPPLPNVSRTPTFLGCGIMPRIPMGNKMAMIIDIGWRKYSWTNSLHTTSSIEVFRTGIGLAFEL